MTAQTRRRPTLEHVVMAALVVAGASATARPLSDNSLFVHLRTGIDMFETGKVPAADPYSFTAPGVEWVVQSWLADWIYGALHAIGGPAAVILLHVALGGVIATMLVLLARSGTMLRTLVAAGIPVAISFGQWSHRPLMFGLLCFAVLVYVVEGDRRWWVLPPVAWLWVNTHGSFPVAFGWLGIALAGHWLDTRTIDPQTVRKAAAFSAGAAAAVLNPVGPELLVFWTKAVGERSEIFASISEWASPDFRTAGNAVVLFLLVSALAICARGAVAWRRLLPVLVLLAAFLVSARYLTFLAIVLAPALAQALRSKSRESEVSSARLAMGALAVVALAAAGMAVRAAAGPDYSLQAYPVEALQALEQSGALGHDDRLVAQDFVGCYLILRADGRKVFIDDRYDMYPAEVSLAYHRLLKGTAPPGPILDRYGADAVIWEKEEPLAQLLGEADGWAKAFDDGRWVAYVRAERP